MQSQEYDLNELYDNFEHFKSAYKAELEKFLTFHFGKCDMSEPDCCGCKRWIALEQLFENPYERPMNEMRKTSLQQ